MFDTYLAIRKICQLLCHFGDRRGSFLAYMLCGKKNLMRTEKTPYSYLKKKVKVKNSL
jgi:hypothetical protein